MSRSFRSGLVSLSFLFVIGAGAVTGCARATVGVNSNTSVPSDSANICAGHCQSIGLQLSSVVVMANNVGCVCAAAPAPGAQAPAAAAAGGMAAILMQEEADAAAAQHNASTSK